MKLDPLIDEACAQVPGLMRSALIVLPEGLLIGGLGAESALDHEPLARAAVACMRDGESAGSPGFVECAFVSEAELVVIQRGRKDARLALAVVCTREPNLALVLSASRRALQRLEGRVVLDEEAGP
jgi:hypothetical protein